MKRLGFILAVIMGCMAFASCEKEEQTPVVEEEVFSTNAIAGNYVGTLTALGYSDDPQRAYVNRLISRLRSRCCYQALPRCPKPMWAYLR